MLSNIFNKSYDPHWDEMERLQKQVTLENYAFNNPLQNIQQQRQNNFLNKLRGKKKMEKENKKPSMKVRSGLMTATVWENKIEKDNKKMVVTSVTLQKSYKDVNDEWQNTVNFNMSDLPSLAKLINDTHTLLTTGDRLEG